MLTICPLNQSTDTDKLFSIEDRDMVSYGCQCLSCQEKHKAFSNNIVTEYSFAIHWMLTYFDIFCITSYFLYLLCWKWVPSERFSKVQALKTPQVIYAMKPLSCLCFPTFPHNILSLSMAPCLSGIHTLSLLCSLLEWKHLSKQRVWNTTHVFSTEMHQEKTLQADFWNNMFKYFLSTERVSSAPPVGKVPAKALQR